MLLCDDEKVQPAIAQLVEHLTVERCRNQMVPGSIPGGRTFVMQHLYRTAKPTNLSQHGTCCILGERDSQLKCSRHDWPATQVPSDPTRAWILLETQLRACRKAEHVHSQILSKMKNDERKHSVSGAHDNAKPKHLV